ncbi:ABC transporter substrate-binding protein [Nonomuraea harbinensis]|uniref:ABC transporter substrate-binding protein n=1 Tax=Nonomuraea harbinensis TaxID=1286938 RepID=A0ABW1C961_9ACTN|nr:ABC transporter substrate-binding protein [Nonomuraea harbinensis]
MKRAFRRAKRGVALAGAAVLMTSFLVACGESGDGGGSGAAETYTIGYVGALTGPFGASGVIALNGLKAGVDYVNTLDGPKFELVSRDTKGDPSAGANLAREVAQSGVGAIYAGTQDIAAMQPVLNQYRVLAADAGGITAILPKIGDDKEFPWTFCPNPACGPNGIVPQLRFVSEIGDGKVGELSDAGPYGAGMTALTESVVKEQFPDMEIVRESFPISATSVTSQLQKLRDAGAETLLLWTYGAPLVMVMQNLDRMGWYPYIGAPLGAGDPSVVDATPEGLKGKIAAGGIAKTQVQGSQKSEVAKAFYDGYAKAGGVDINSFKSLDTVGSYSFDWAVVLHAAIKGAGSTEPEKVKDWLTAGNTVEGAQGPLTFGKSGEERIGLSLDDTTVYDPSQPCSDGQCAPMKTP